MTLIPSAAFVSAGGYHHHLGFNTWRGQDAPPAPADAVGLREWTIVLPEAADVAEVRARSTRPASPPRTARGFKTADPWGNAVLIAAP